MIHFSLLKLILRLSIVVRNKETELESSEKIVYVGDIVCIKIKTRKYVPLKFKAELSTPHDIVRIRSVTRLRLNASTIFTQIASITRFYYPRINLLTQNFLTQIFKEHVKKLLLKQMSILSKTHGNQTTL
jgi:hypothetical protein